VFQNAVLLEFSSDGAGFQEAMFPIDTAKGYITLPVKGNQLQIRATALRAGCYIGGYVAVPWYINSPVTRRVPIDIPHSWGDSDSDFLLASERKPMFSMWSRPYPRRYSLDQVGGGGSIPLVGAGFRP